MGDRTMMHHGRDLEKLKGAKLDRAVMLRVWRFVRRYHTQVYLYLAVVAFSSAIAVLPPLVFRALIDDAIPSENLGAVTALAVAALLLSLASVALSLLGGMMAVRVGEGLIYDLRSALYDHVQRMPIAFFTRTQTGALISRLNNDVVGAQQAVTSTLSTTVSSTMGVAFTLITMLYLDWRITLFALALVPVYLLVSQRVGRVVQKIARRQMEMNAAMNAVMTERFNVSGALLVKLFGRPDDEASQFSLRAGEVRDAGIRRSMVSRTFAVALTAIAAAGTAGLYLFGGRAVVLGTLSIGTVVAFAAYLQQLYSPISALSTTRVDILSALVSFERVFEVLDTPLAISDAPGAVALESPRGRIEVDDVWFRYPAAAGYTVASLEAEGMAGAGAEASDWVLRGVSLVAEPGTMTALVGPSGAGKTTLSHLIARLYDVTSGGIRVDGEDLRNVQLQTLADSIAVVSQDAHLFHDSIAANLRYARPGATDEEIVAACRSARIHDLIAELPDGYDTVVGERGYRMSGGEKQRIAIARVLLKAPAIVILDEATAHLDYQSEAHIQRALAIALEGRTSIVIAHRLSTIRAADQILVLDHGRVAQRGTHEELLREGGVYASLYKTQFATQAPQGPMGTAAG
ncbi:MAG: ABC transporter ATP-binding protein/permease [Actinomycetota bacterium]|nr:ABC transporter ATP-binding protein/permease [Actinomycetota bacterium]